MHGYLLHTCARTHTLLYKMWPAHAALCICVYWGISGGAGMPIKAFQLVCRMCVGRMSTVTLAHLGQALTGWLRPLLVKTRSKLGANVMNCDSHPNSSSMKDRWSGAGTWTFVCANVSGTHWELVGGKPVRDQVLANHAGRWDLRGEHIIAKEAP